jgi:integrase
MSHDLHKISVRKALPARREPYWGAPLEAGRYIGYRSIDDGTGTWIARMRGEDGKQKYSSLGQATADFDYTQAKQAADIWFKGRDEGVSDKPPTVEDACKEYVTDLKAEGRDAAAYDAEIRFKRSVYNDSIAKVRLDKIRTAKLKAWRNGIAGGKSGQDRSFRSLKAALNFAVMNRRVSPAVAIEWKSVQPHKGADKRRELYLDLKQRRALIAAASGDTRDLIQAAALTGARPGELVALKRSSFDARTSTMTFKGKTGARTVPLSPAAVTLFKRLSKGKMPSASMLTVSGEPWTFPAVWAREIRAAAKAAKMPKGVVLYTLRHSWITEALRAGMSTLDVARLTGTSLQMIQEHYGHLVADSARERLAGVTML